MTRARIFEGLDRVAESPWFAYGSILAIQAKLLCGIWRYRDLSPGDTSNYFIQAQAWADHRWVDPLFSPLYTSLWGTLLSFVHDIYATTIAHRVIIVLLVSLLVLVVLRRLLSPGIAWLIAVWWAVLPVNYDTLVEVHLFSLIPVLIAALVALRWSGRGMRAAVFGVLLVGAILQRNELVVAAGVWLGICVVYELGERRGQERGTPVLRRVAPYALALVASFLLLLLSISRAPQELSVGEWVDRAQYKQDFALCQHYAVGYQQRHHADGNIAWQHCQMFMQRDFDSPTPSFFEALASNPSAMATHFGWNLRLSPYAAQLALFDGISGSRRHDPDYIPVHEGSALVLVASLALAVFLAVGLWLLWVRRRHWWEDWIRERAWGWAVLGSVGAMSIWVGITTHPRPSYLFPLSFSGMAVIGMCAMAIVDRWPGLGRLRAGLPVAAVLLVVLVPNHYRSGYSNPLFGPGRPVADMVSRLEPYRDRLAGSDTRLLARNAYEACNYLEPVSPCTPEQIGLIGPGTATPAVWVDRQGIDLIYADEEMLSKASTRRILDRLQQEGWRRIAPAQPGTGWLLLGRVPGPPANAVAR
ncbi:MAG: hypothetical protein ACJ75Z_00245 [Solirubrobacterales bacterium]